MDDYLNKPCERCGSKKIVSRRWNDTIQTLTGSTKVEYSQIVCTNKKCQKAFDETLLKEKNKRQEIKRIKEENDKKRKENSLLMVKKAKRLKKIDLRLNRKYA
ncbi:MAG: hypothetical protein Q7K55_09540 [Candidatus Levybacteria bacterium]|nr:hypothetical protein [Candidatus Levybacteria bacterium]